MFVCCECCVLSGRGLCDELITRPEESYQLWCVFVCDLENPKNEEVMTRVWSQRHSIKKACSFAAKKRRHGQSSGAGPGALAAAGHIVLLCLEQMYRNRNLYVTFVELCLTLPQTLSLLCHVT
jgi:hypothetical protein